MNHPSKDQYIGTQRMDLHRKPALGRNVQDPHVHVTLAVRWTRSINGRIQGNM